VDGSFEGDSVALLLAVATGCRNALVAAEVPAHPGRRAGRFSEAVWQEYDCGSQKRPFIIERNELVPPEVRLAGEFNHRLVYVMCPGTDRGGDRKPATRIRFKGNPIVVDSVPAWDLAGR
jgi:hypothetical protein